MTIDKIGLDHRFDGKNYYYYYNGLSELPSQENVVKAGKTDTVGKQFLEFTEAQTNRVRAG